MAATSPTEARLDGRIRSNVAHEFSHVILGHDVRRVQKIAEHYFFTCNPEQEEEANWLAGALLLPRPLLVEAARQRLSDEQISTLHNVSVEMARFRMNATGAKMQVARARRSRSAWGPKRVGAEPFGHRPTRRSRGRSIAVTNSPVRGWGLTTCSRHCTLM